MANDNLPKKLSFFDKIKMIFSGNLESTLQENSALREQLAAYEARDTELAQREADVSHREAELEEEKSLLAQKEADLSDREIRLEQEKRALTLRASKLKESEVYLANLQDEARRTQLEGEYKIRAASAIAQERADAAAEARISRIQNTANEEVAQAHAEADAKVAEAEAASAAAIQSAEEREAEADKFLKGKISAGEITAGKGEQGSAMTIFFEQQIIQATEKLKADIAELESVGGDPEIKERLIANYQANLLGSLLAYMDFDSITNPETKKIIETKVQKAIISIVEKHPEAKKAFTKGYIVTKYQAYDGKFSFEDKKYPDLDSFADNYGSNNSYFEGKNTDFRDPVTTATMTFRSVDDWRSDRSQTHNPSTHFLPRTDFSSLDFRIDPNLKVPQKSTSERPVSYSPDLASTVKRITETEGFNR